MFLDARKQEELTQDVLPLLKKVTNLYMLIPFRSRQYVKLDDFNALTQVLCMGGEKFISNFQSTDGDIVHEELENVNMYKIGQTSFLLVCVNMW